ncbi:MAG TPA: Na(+)-translocating NADH-quinone reductase subunit C [Vicinamibacteria bacterium]|nr:Na(+)-translocating NADH-quinone reductase subunit C [Vicinamibacteria bacterium]
MQRSAAYSIVFATIVCLVCAVVVSSSAVSLKEKQETNAYLDKQRNVLVAAGLAGDSEELSSEEVKRRFEPILSTVVSLETGEPLPDVDPATFDQRKVASDPATSSEAPRNPAGVERIPEQALVYRLEEGGKLKLIILPIEGKGLWSTLYGFIALDAELQHVRGITFYEHKETPGLGGEVDNPNWKALWKGRQAFDEDFQPAIEVIRGKAGPPEEDPYRVDGLSGATMTSRGVTNLVQFWLGEHGFGKYLEKLRENVS